MSDDLKSHWVSFIDDLAMADARYYSGPQKILQGRTWVVPGKLMFDRSVDLQTFGYKESGNKMSQLRRNYYNRESMKKAYKGILRAHEQRTYGSAQFSLRNIEKAKQDFCMVSGTATHYPAGGIEICIFYRVTEPIKKFGADLVLLGSILRRFNHIKYVENVTFMFSNLSWHPMFICTYLAYHPEPVLFLKAVKANDPKWHKGICKWAIKYLFEADSKWVQNFSIAKQNAQAMDRLMDDETKEDLRNYFEEYR